MVDLVGRSDLVDPAGIHDDDPVGERHRFNLIMGHVNRCGRDLLMHLFDFGAHLHAQFGVEVRQRLVEQKHFGVAHDRPTHRDPLALAAGKLLWPPVEKGCYVEDAGRRFHSLFDFGFRKLLQPQAERHIFEHRHMRV